MSGMDQYQYASRFRDWARSVIRKEITEQSPPTKMGTVKSIDYAALTSGVQFDDDPFGDLVPVRFGYSTMPTNLDQRARIAGNQGDRYIADLVTPPVWVDMDLSSAESWVSNGGAYADPQYRRTPDGLVMLRGSISDGSIPGFVANIPHWYRPEFTMAFYGAFGRIQVGHGGDIVVKSAPGGASEFNFDGIMFEAAYGEDEVFDG